MRRTVDTQYDASPESCHQTAFELDQLSRAVSRSSVALTRHAGVKDELVGGLSGEAYRRLNARIGADSDDFAHDLKMLARALVEFGADIHDITWRLRQAREVAAHQLYVDGFVVHAPQKPRRLAADDPALGLQWVAWDNVVDIVDRARHRQARSEADWVAALTRFAGLSCGDVTRPYHPQIDHDGSTFGQVVGSP